MMRKYLLAVNNVVIDQTPLEGLAVIKLQTARLLFGDDAVLVQKYVGDNFDPVLHKPLVYNIENGGWDHFTGELF